MIVLALTGSIAMGKSRAATAFRVSGAPVFDADAAVHALMAPGGAAVREVAAAFPGSFGTDGGIDRQQLGRAVLGDALALRRLEAILHPKVRAAEGGFLRRCCRAGERLALLDIPLLFETHGEGRVDAVVVVSAHPLLQRQRALRRPGMTDEKLAQIRAKQLPDPAKRRRRDYLIPSGADRGLLMAEVHRVILHASCHPRAARLAGALARPRRSDRPPCCRAA
jgi:dephospho-CoA kinase